MDPLKKIVGRIERRLMALETNATAASRAAGLSAGAIRNLQRGAKGEIPVKGGNAKTFDALAPVLKTTVAWLTKGEEPEVSEDGVPTRASNKMGSKAKGGPKRLPLGRRVVPIGEEFEPDVDASGIVTDQHRPFPDALPQMIGRIGGGSTGAVITIDVGEMQSREEVGEWWRIPPAVLRGLARSDVASTVGFAMDGDSMEPTIQRTDIVFVDTKRRDIEPDGIWALDYGLGRTLKRVMVQRIDGNTRYILKSDNPAYPDQQYDPGEVTIFGRYVGRFSVF
ncbi:MAG: putative phage repressor [Bradyrhizobium sp.]|nr:putative phage repressor [Bradyrhizobium sp.]